MNRIKGALPLIILTTLSVLMSAPRVGPAIPIGISIVQGSSMFPTLESGDVLILESIKLTEIKPGDIAIYRNGNNLVVHRIIGISGDTVFFQGDNNVNPDMPVKLENVSFKVVGKLPGFIWAVLLGITLAVTGISIRNLNSEGIPFSVFYYFLVFILLMNMALQTVAFPPTYPVKSNPVPDIKSVRINGTDISVELENLYPVREVLCSADNQPVLCSYNCSTILIKLNETSQNLTLVRIELVADSEYNLTTTYYITIP